VLYLRISAGVTLFSITKSHQYDQFSVQTIKESRNQESRNQESRNQGIKESRIKNQESRIKNQESRIKNQRKGGEVEGDQTGGGRKDVAVGDGFFDDGLTTSQFIAKNADHWLLHLKLSEEVAHVLVGLILNCHSRDVFKELKLPFECLVFDVDVILVVVI